MSHGQPTNVAVMIGQLQQGGSERQLYGFLKHCDRTRWQPIVYVSGELGIWETPIRQLGIPIILLRGNPLTKMWQFRRSCKVQHVRSFFSWSSYTNGFGLALTGMPVRRISSFRNKLFDDLPQRFRRLWVWMSLHNVNTVVCNSHATEQALQPYLGAGQRLMYVPNSVERVADPAQARKQWRERLGITKDEQLVLGVGRLVAQKNFLRFIETIAIVQQAVPVRAVIAGEDQGCRPELEQSIIQHGLGHGILQLCGAVADARELMCAADVFLLSSDFEGMPNVVLEAMAAGVPCVCTRVNGVSELIEDGVNGFICDHSTQALAEKLVLLLNDGVLRTHMGEKAEARMHNGYDAAKLSARLWALCE